MSEETERARRALQDLPNFSDSSRGLKLLDEIEQSERKFNEHLRELEATREKARLTPSEIRYYKMLEWVTLVIAVCAAYVGIDAILNSEYCFSTRRGGFSCSRGLKAQFSGATTLLIGVLIALIPRRPSPIKTVAMVLTGVLGYVALLAALSARSN